jgi:hypothetical protein
MAMTKAAFDRMYADPQFQALSTAEKQEVLKAARTGTYTYVGERPPPQDVGADIPTPATVRPAPGVTPAPGVLNQPTDVEVDEQGRVKTAQFLPQAQREVEMTTPKRPFGQRVGQEIGGLAGPKVGGAAQLLVESAAPVAGGILGGLAGTGAGGIGAIPGAMAGSATGEVINQALGITEPSPPQVGLAAAGPAVGYGVGKVAGKVVGGVTSSIKAMPGIWDWVRQRGFDRIAGATRKYAVPEEAVDVAYDVARQTAKGAPMVGLPQTKAAVQQFVAGQAPGGPVTPKQRMALKLYDQVQNLLRPTVRDPVTGQMQANPAYNFSNIVHQLDRIGGALGEYRKRAAGLGPIKHLWGSMVEDLETAAASGHIGSEAARTAAAVYKHRLGILEMDEAIKFAKKAAPGKAAYDRLVRGLEKTQTLLPPEVHAVLTDVVEAFKRRPDRPLGQLSALFGIGAGYGTGSATAALSMLAPRAVWDGLRHAVPLDATTLNLLALGYQGARRLALMKQRQGLHRGGDPETDYGLDPDERDLAEADAGAQKGTP